MITATELGEWEDNFQLADKIIARKRRGIPVDRWATTDEMRIFVDTCAIALDCVTVLLDENDRLKDEMHKKGIDAMSLSDDTETKRSV